MKCHLSNINRLCQYHIKRSLIKVEASPPAQPWSQSLQELLEGGLRLVEFSELIWIWQDPNPGRVALPLTLLIFDFIFPTLMDCSTSGSSVVRGLYSRPLRCFRTRLMMVTMQHIRMNNTDTID